MNLLVCIQFRNPDTNSNTIIFVFQSIVFNPPIFHPKVDPVTGHMETKTSFGKWQLGVRSLNFCAAVNNLNHVSNNYNMRDVAL